MGSGEGGGGGGGGGVRGGGGGGGGGGRGGGGEGEISNHEHVLLPGGPISYTSRVPIGPHLNERGSTPKKSNTGDRCFYICCESLRRVVEAWCFSAPAQGCV